MPTEQRTIAVAEKSQLKEVSVDCGYVSSSFTVLIGDQARKYEDDWTGVTSAKDRRKIQNRLHQRAWRELLYRVFRLETYIVSRTTQRLSASSERDTS